jgi:choline dehydrogenase-like flavoprotein
MGTSTSPFAVTDGKGRVYGVEGLRVADISLFPSMLTLYLCLIVCICVFMFCVFVFFVLRF